MIPDTTFLIDIMDSDEKAVQKLHELIRRGETQIVTSISLFELFSGLSRSKKPTEERRKVLEVLRDLLSVTFDPAAAEKAGEIDGQLIREGKMIGPNDSMIAGIALVKKEKILTRNIKDFSKIAGLDVETY